MLDFKTAGEINTEIRKSNCKNSGLRDRASQPSSMRTSEKVHIGGTRGGGLGLSNTSDVLVIQNSGAVILGLLEVWLLGHGPLRRLCNVKVLQTS